MTLVLVRVEYFEVLNIYFEKTCLSTFKKRFFFAL